MKHERLYKFLPEFVFRTPSIPLQKEETHSLQLFEATKLPFIKEAIYIASPVLYNELIKWHRNELNEEKEIDRLIASVKKYYTRMQSRCTPYGLFAACGTGMWSDRNEILIDNSLKRHTRLDMNYLCSLAQKLNASSVLLPLLRFYPNNSLYSFGGELRYVEYKYINNSRAHQISSVDYSDYLQSILKLANKGASIQDLVSFLVCDDISFEEAEGFIMDLIHNQILISELEPAVTGDEFIYQIISILKKINTEENNEINLLIKSLEKVQLKIANLDTLLGNDITEYRKICDLLKIFDLPIEENQMFQIDLFKNTSHSTLNIGMQNQLHDAIDFINKLSLKQPNSNLTKFKENFYSRYQDAEVSLLEVLDTETGIGYIGKDTSGINSLIDDIYISHKQQQQSLTINWDQTQDFLHNKLIYALQNNKYNINLKDEDLKTIDNSSNILPDSIAIMFRLIDENNIFLQSGGGSSAANLLGRFAHGNKEIHKIIEKIALHEKDLNCDKILAEIVHLPESRLGNILLRPVFREYEIPYLGKSAISKEKQILLDDLFISLKSNKIILRSKRLNKEIIPRLSTAHNYSHNALPVYQLLCDLQSQYFEKISFGFNWGNLANTFKFLPRATYKNIILEKAKWQLQKEDFQVLLNSKREKHDSDVVAWKKQWNIPQFVLLVDNDNELLINFNDDLSLRMFINTIKKRDRIILEEFLFDKDNLLIKDEKGNGYTNEFIAILLKHTLPYSGGSINRLDEATMIQRDFFIGSEWFYYKFYCGVKTSDKLLVDAIKPLIVELTENKLINKFFYVRYSDPDIHIRLRLNICSLDNIGTIASIVMKHINPFILQGLVTNTQIDTYKREVERYGQNSIELSESLFYQDSIATLDLLDSTTGDEGNLLRWQFGLRSIEDLLELFAFTLDEKIDLMKTLKTSFFEEHGGDKELKVQLDNKFRNSRKHVESVMNKELENNYPLINLLHHKKTHMRPIAEKIMQLNKNKQLSISIDNLLSSYIHMMLNRIFNARQRICELVIYDLLHKYYKSKYAKDNRLKG